MDEQNYKQKFSELSEAVKRFIATAWTGTDDKGRCTFVDHQDVMTQINNLLGEDSQPLESASGRDFETVQSVLAAFFYAGKASWKCPHCWKLVEVEGTDQEIQNAIETSGMCQTCMEVFSRIDDYEKSLGEGVQETEIFTDERF